jgi:hypothetical protein
MKKKRKRGLEEIPDQVWCDSHGCIHDRTIDPYDYGYGDPANCPHEDSTPECGPKDWRKLWIGAEDDREYVMPGTEVKAKEKPKRVRWRHSFASNAQVQAEAALKGRKVPRYFEECVRCGKRVYRVQTPKERRRYCQ